MFDLLVYSPVIVGALMIAGILLEFGLGKVGFLKKGLGLVFDKEKNAATQKSASIVFDSR